MPITKIKEHQKELHMLQSRIEEVKHSLRKEIKLCKREHKSPDKKMKNFFRSAASDISESFFLQVTLGVCELKLPEKAKHKYKTSYETFKLTSTIGVTLLTLINLILVKSKIMDTFQILSHLYIYSTLTIREHILLNNGSNIKKWWIFHHYICIVIAAMMFSCPEYSFSLIRNIILKFLFFLSCSQLVQYQYQMRRLYVLRSLEKDASLETTSDHMTISLATNFIIVSLLLIFFQFIQMYVAYSIYTLHLKYKWTHYQPLVGSILIFTMAVGNVVAIVHTCYDKIQKKRRKQPFA
ncbi:hypothetical protein NEFER03_0499 [Nematocida sp. LUAm3]|nr:hypothetical protein NEFER03_0499 [Nematocida sp. LUAm3]KAI5175466.1 hypothetical protein NEFER02_1372 [Nematocida sp. LUAm2]KAI5178504.1 hypothetical protein NEFER01_1651 [Nematocida sp. LUAm1]